MAEEFDKSPRARKGNQPITWKDAKEGYNVGDEKTFPDGSQRVLNYSPSGLRRWLGTGQQEDKAKEPGNSNGINEQQPSNLEFQYPKEIVKPEWVSFNNYLTEDNPFLYASTYDEVVAIWFRIAYDIDNKIDVIKEEIFILDSLNLSDSQKRKEILEFELRQIEEKYKTLDNQFLAYIMYKVNVAIIDIERFDLNFDYDGWVNKGRTWNEIYDYLEKVQQSDYFNNKQMTQ